ncbi:MAG: PQQ-binding-like beta-propeller repeat protein [Gemmataceae bacterium]
MLPRRQSTFGVLLLLFTASTVRSADWPQWLGSQRDGVWRETGILDKLPKEGPKVLWKKPIDGGYSGPAVVGGRIYVMDRESKKPKGDEAKGTLPGNERILCLDLKTGETIWKHEYDRPYINVNRPMGPRTTPVVDGNHVYTLGSMGDLYCVDAKTGKPVWNKFFGTDYNAKPPVWGFSAHLLVDKNLVYALVGGEGKAIVAFDKNTGKEVWSALTSKDVGYAPPVIAEVGGVRQLIVWLSDSLAGLKPETGELYWKFTHPEKNFNPAQPALTIITPKIVGNKVYVSSTFDGLCVVKLDADPKKSGLDFRSKTSAKGASMMPVLMTSLIHRDGHLYGLAAETGEVLCVKASDGSEVWKSDDLFGGKAALFGSAFWVENGDRQWTFTDQGDLVILNLTPKGYEEISRAHVMDPVGSDRGRKVIWSHPAFAEKKMIFRNEKEIICVSLAKD